MSKYQVDWSVMGPLVTIVVTLLATAAPAHAQIYIGAKAGAANPEQKAKDAGLTRRRLVCMMALGGMTAVGGVAEAMKPERATWDSERHRLEVSADIQSDLGTLLNRLSAALPGMVTNTVLAAAMDSVAEYMRAADEIPDKSSPTYFDTIMKANMVMIGKIGASIVIPNSGNASITPAELERYKANPLSMALETAVMAPLIEEILFRLLPSRIGTGWAVGTGSSLLFAAGHNLTSHGFSSEKIPTTQFIGGMFYWYLMRERGLSHSIFAHAANNNAYNMAMFLNGRIP